MNETIPTSPLWDQIPFFPQTTCGFENPYTLTPHYQTSFSPNFTTIIQPPTTEQANLSPEVSSTTGNSGERSPKPSTSSKPIRRRSRASKKTPTTLLTASISNFRAVVQQYTGCRRRRTPPPTPFKNHRGPVILRFGQPAHRNLSPEDSDRRLYSDQELQYPNDAHHFQQGQGHQELCRVASYDNSSSHGSYISGVENDRSSSMLCVDDYEW